MRISVHSTYGYIAAGALALLAAPAPALFAQGGQKAAPRSVEATVAHRRLEPARGILSTLAGTWRFEIWFAGNFDGPPDASGTRVVKRLYDDLRVEWTEVLDSSQIRGQGIIGFDSRNSRFFSTAVYSAGSAPELMAGTLDHAEPRIEFSPIALPADADPSQRLAQSSVLTLLDGDHYLWTASDRGWRAVFTRLP